ncbi:MAG: archaemetzincin family Zn-dependent metalloprotease [Candidatus Bathyarchaeia archaeon]
MKLTTSESLGLLQVGDSSDHSLDALMDPLQSKYPWFEVETLPPFLDIAEAFDSRRIQYHSTRILALLEKHIQSTQVCRLLAITDYDIYAPGMNFVFGEARLAGRVGVISTHRLKATGSETHSLYAERMVKEAVHEVGHTLGLNHCQDELCVMHLSESLEDTDMKGSSLCGKCQQALVELRNE